MNLLNNPKTFSQAEVIRALEIRKIFNQEDVMWMMYFTITIVALIILSGTLLIYNELKNFTQKVVLLAVVSTVLLISVIGISSSYIHLNAVGNSPHQWGLMRLFYLYDGVIIMTAYINHISYELTNIILFGIFQPSLILFLYVMVLLKQRS